MTERDLRNRGSDGIVMDLNSQKKGRVWEIDALRGHLILWVLIYHLYFTVYEFCINGGYTNFDAEAFSATVDPLQFFFDTSLNNGLENAPFYRFLEFYHKPAVALFFVVSGVSTHFSTNKLKASLRLVCSAAFVSLFTAGLARFSGDKGQFIRFGVLHCYAACHLIHYFILEKCSDRVLFITAVSSMFIGHLLRLYPIYSDFALLVPFGVYERGAVGRDYWPVFPMLGWFLLGIVLGKHLYSQKATRFPEQESKKWYRPLCFLGRHSGLLYCGHIVVYPILFYGMGYILNLY